MAVPFRPSEYGVDGGKPVDTTSVHNEQYRTFAPAVSDDFASAADAFNQLSPIPAKPIDLGDGRTLRIVQWSPVCDDETGSGYLRISIDARITMAPKERTK